MIVLVSIICYIRVTNKLMDRKDVYAVIDGERNYQDNKWGPQANSNKPVESYIVYMQAYLADAIQAISKNAGTKLALDELRKVVALGVSCFEVNGVPNRKATVENEDGLTTPEKFIEFISENWIRSGLYKENQFYKSFYAIEPISFEEKEVNSKFNFGTELFQSICSSYTCTPKEDLLSELYGMFMEQLCMEALTATVKMLDVEVKDMTFVKSVDSIPFVGNMMMGPEMLANLYHDYKCTPNNISDFSPLFMGAERCAKFKDKNVYVNPFLPEDVFLLFNEGFMNFDILFDPRKSDYGYYMFNLKIRVNKNNVRRYKISDAPRWEHPAYCNIFK